LLAILWFSYWQTVAAYPSNGGSYIVAKDNLGTGAGLLAGTALMVDYMLNVAVGISSGIGALTSALPILHPWTLWLCLVVLVVITLMNLRGTRESGLAWAIPTYLFIASLGFILVWGVIKAMGVSGHPQAVVQPPAVAQSAEAITVWLVLRAFASGCTAMTGVEAVSNGVSAFREPRVRHAHGTLSVIVIVLGFLLVCIAHVAQAYDIMAMDQTKEGYQSVLSQIVGAVYGRGWLYYVTIGSVLAVLCLSANTSFVDFPRLCHLVAQDGFLPKAFAVPGRRLVYTAGILFLAAGSGALLTVFGGITDRLIPLFAVGAFLSFTLSQAGMAAHWRRSTEGRGRHAKLLINGTGAIATGVALVIILLAKFVEGAWLTVVVIPCTLMLLLLVRRYYDDVDAQLLAGSNRRIDVRNREEALVIVPISRWDRVSRKAIEYALRLSNDVTALHVTTLAGPDGEEHENTLRREWTRFVETPARESGLRPPKLQLIPSQFRSVVAPVLREIEEARDRFPCRPVFIVLPEIVEGRWWGYLLHTHRERRVRARLLRYGGPTVAVIGVPWQLTASEPEEGLAEEEPVAAS
ncbi:MAG: APC family permease, partial [Acetobacteraceae bacterium]|nr:APC family permease [Acetobacteraceae bacterium]